MAEIANVYLARIPQYQDRLRKYKVFLDGKQVGEIERDQTLKFEVEAGEHSLRLSIDWVGSNTLVFNARSNQDTYVECGNNVGTKLFKMLVALTVARNSYLYVKRMGS